jgi:endonuclease/exonuclease/phosphatase family metal-dependent hydrolase
LRIATFNIEFFPKSQRQVEGAFDLIESLDSSIVAVQEITDPDRFRGEARRRLGRDWAFVHSVPRARIAHPPILLGVLFDGRRFRLQKMQEHQLGGRRALVVTLSPRSGGQPLTVVVVHLRSGSAGRKTREGQFRRLRQLLADLLQDGHQLVVLGDFNATEEGDRRDLARLAKAASLHWATEGLECSAFWQRREDCPRSRLDHVLTPWPTAEVIAAGACQTEGCERDDSCPIYRDEISDHCPVVVTADASESAR